jgi:chemotaxis-related protein WspB
MLLLTFTAGPNRYAVNVVRVVEVVPRVDLRTIPHAPAFLAGLLGYRGKVVPVIDLGLLLASLPCQDRLSTRIILVNTARRDHNSKKKQDRNDSLGGHGQDGAEPEPSSNLLGLVAEHVSELTHAQPDQTVPLLIHLPEAPYLDAVLQTEEGIVQLIKVEGLRDSILASFQQRTAASESLAETVNSASDSPESGT